MIPVDFCDTENIWNLRDKDTKKYVHLTNDGILMDQQGQPKDIKNVVITYCIRTKIRDARGLWLRVSIFNNALSEVLFESAKASFQKWMNANFTLNDYCKQIDNNLNSMKFVATLHSSLSKWKDVTGYDRKSLNYTIQKLEYYEGDITQEFVYDDEC